MSIYKVMSLNLKNDVFPSVFQRRAQSLQEMIRTYDPDLIGVQELTDMMMEYLGDLTSVYGFYGAARGTSLSYTDERCCILYRKDRFRLREGKTLWLSDSPEVRGSRYPGSTFPRIVSTAVLEDSLHTFVMANTHLDHMFAYVRYRQADKLAEILSTFTDHEFMILTGDFNTPLTTLPLKRLTEKTGLQDAVPENPSTSLRNIMRLSSSRFLPIDHVFVSKNIHVIRSRLVAGMFMGRFPSDHLPLYTEIEYSERYL